MKRLRIGISSCLLGDEVRFDGGHKRDASLIDALGPYVEWVRVCPEVELGLGVPREPVRLVSAGGGSAWSRSRRGSITLTPCVSTRHAGSANWPWRICPATS